MDNSLVISRIQLTRYDIRYRYSYSEEFRFSWIYFLLFLRGFHSTNTTKVLQLLILEFFNYDISFVPFYHRFYYKYFKSLHLRQNYAQYLIFQKYFWSTKVDSIIPLGNLHDTSVLILLNVLANIFRRWNLERGNFVG